MFATAPTPTVVIRVITIVEVTIIVTVDDAPASVLNNIDTFEVQITSKDQRSVRKRQTKEPITFTVKNTIQSYASFEIPSDQLSTLRKGSKYSVKVSV